MRNVIATRWRNLLAGFLFRPGAVALAFIGLAVLVIRIDRTAGPNGVQVAFAPEFIRGGDAAAASTILSTIAGSLITVAGLAFSLTIVTLQLVSAQFSPRAMRGFLADRVNQLTAGAFVGIFAYCLLVLRSVRSRTPTALGFVPTLGVVVGVALGVLGLALLLLFIHNVAQSIQVSSMTARIARTTLRTVNGLFPAPYGEPGGREADEVADAWRARGEPTVVVPPRPGYVQTIDLDGLVDALERPGTRLIVRATPGDFVTEETPIVSIWPPVREDERDRAVRAVHRSVHVDSARDLDQDAGYGIRQLADIALRAVSPGVNDPTTAITCIGYLRACLERIAARRFSSELREYPTLDVQIVARRRTFAEYVEEAFAELGRYGAADVRVAAAVLEALASVVAVAAAREASARVEILLDAAAEAADAALARAPTESARDLLRDRLARVEAAAGAA